VFGACGSSAFYRRDLLLALGGFADCFGAYFEDVDLSFRIHQAGYQVYYEPQSRVRHHQGSSHGRCRRLLEQQSRNEERVFWRNIPSSTLGPAILRHLAVLAGKAVRRWQEGTLAPFVCGRLRLLGELGAIQRRRAGLGRHRPDDLLVEKSYWGVGSPLRE
jgi:GT2 family glycosyltransferase